MIASTSLPLLAVALAMAGPTSALDGVPCRAYPTQTAGKNHKADPDKKAARKRERKARRRNR